MSVDRIVFLSVALVLSVGLVCNAQGATDTGDEAPSAPPPPPLVPTCEWQEILPHQNIPPGLDISVNLETGLRQARLRCDSEGKVLEQRWGHSGALALKDETEDKAAARRRHVALSGAAERINNALEHLQVRTSDEQTAAVLEELEDLVHDRDAAQDFVGLDGLSVVGDLVHATAWRVRMWALWVLGTTVQNNPKTQDAALRHGLVSLVTTVLRNETEDAVKQKALYALSSQLRTNIPSQQVFVARDGLTLLLDCVRKPALAHKTVTLVSDVVMEDTDASSMWLATLRATGWCDIRPFPEADDVAEFVRGFTVFCNGGGWHIEEPAGVESAAADNSTDTLSL